MYFPGPMQPLKKPPKKAPHTFVILSEAKNLSFSICPNQREIPRFARNDKINDRPPR
jgi:hypothetical protein